MTRDDPVLLDLHGPVAVLTINRAERHNALDAAAIDCFHERLDAIDAAAELRAVLLTGSGEGRTFCAGASLKEIRSGALDPARFTTLTDRFAALALPSVCAVNGSVYGGGVELALCADFRIGVHGSRLRVPAAQLGLCYPPNGMRRFLSRLGLQASRRLLLLAEQLEAEQMLDLGFLDRVVAPSELQAVALSWCTDLARLAPLAVAAMKRSLNGLADNSIGAAELDALAAACASSEDLQEGLAAQAKGREPRFRRR